MMKKKILSAVLALSMVAALAGCGGASSSAPSAGATAPSSEAASGSPASEAPAAPSEEAVKIGFIGPLTGGAAIYGTAAKNGEHPRYNSGKNSHKMQQNVKISPKADRNPFLPPISHNRAKNRATSTYSAGER